MDGSRATRWLRMAWVCGGLALLTACGGGSSGTDSGGGAGVGGGDGVSQARFEWTTTAPVAARTIEGSGVQLTLKGRLTGLRVDELVQFVFFEANRPELFASGDVFQFPTPDDNGVDIGLILQSDATLPAGDHVSEIHFGICADDSCTALRPGSERALRVNLTVDPNISLPANATLARAGADPAVELRLAYTAPPEAGEITAQFLSDTGGIELVSFGGGEARLVGKQVRAGTYTGRLRLGGSSHPRYFKESVIAYTVTAPPGGEKELAVEPSFLFLPVHRGDVMTQRLTVTWPTFTSDQRGPTADALCDPAVFSVTPVDPTHWDLRIAAVAQASDRANCALQFAAGDRTVQTVVNLLIDPALAVAQSPPVEVTALTTAADLRRSSSVDLFDAAALPWTATSSSPWLRLVTRSGTTGRDALVIEADPAKVQAMVDQGSTRDHADVTVTVIRAGGTPVTQTVSYDLSIVAPFATTVWPGALVGTKGRVYLSPAGNTEWLPATRPIVSGATVTASALVRDEFLLTDERSVQLDLDGAVPGQPVRLSFATPLFTRTLEVPVEADVALPAAFQSLPFAGRRPPTYSSRHRALFWAEPERIRRWSSTATTGWQLAQQSVPGLIDTDPHPDERRLFATVPDAWLEFDPVTLVQTRRTDIADLRFIRTDALVWWSAPDWRSKALTHLSDGRPWIEMSADGGATPTTLSPIKIGLINTSQGATLGADQVPLTTASAGRRSLSLSLTRAAEPARATWFDIDGDNMGNSNAVSDRVAASVTADVRAVAVSDDRRTHITADGVAWLDGRFSSDLRAALPAGHRAAGWALSGDGRHALAYSHRLDSAQAVASEPQVQVLVLQGLNWGSGAVPARIASIDLGGLPGCGAPLATGEACLHTAHLLVTPSGRNAFVLGPRGVATVPLPDAVGAATAATALGAGGRRQTAPWRASGGVPGGAQGGVYRDADRAR